MKTINKDSFIWKYLLYTRQKNIITFRHDGVASVCWLFWKVLINILYMTFYTGIFVTVVCLLAFWGVFVVFSGVYIDLFTYVFGLPSVTMPFEGMVEVSLITNYLLGGSIIFYIVGKNIKHQKDNYPVLVLTKDYVKAKRDKVCPVVKFVDNTD